MYHSMTKLKTDTKSNTTDLRVIFDLLRNQHYLIGHRFRRIFTFNFQNLSN